MEINVVEKPVDWPCNNGEVNLDLIIQAVDKLKNEPNYKNKERLLSLLDVTDLNEIDERGLINYSDYEVALLNHLYREATFLGCTSLKLYLYGYIARKTLIYKTLNNMGLSIGKASSAFIKEFEGLDPPLKLFYYSYAQFKILKEKEFAEYLKEITKSVFYGAEDQIKDQICRSFTMLLFDLSFANSHNVFPYLSFDRKTIKNLFQLCAQLNKMVKCNVGDHPLRGTLKIAIRQWILKSRNYNYGYIYKSISIKNTMLAYFNNQIWMSEICKLNDKREQKVVRELFARKNWLKYEWAKKIQIHELKDSFVCSFSTQAPSSIMKRKYGSVVFGYKSDRIANLLAPITIINGYPHLDQVAWYDIIYDREVAKEEINYLCDIINAFDLSDAEKAQFFEDIMVYWYLSFKDQKWAAEKERRYQLFIFDYKTYNETTIENNFLKTKSTLYTYPDFIFTDDEIVKSKALKFRKDKINGLMTQDYIFCNDCLQASRALFGKEHEKFCPVCGSQNIQFHKGI